jgi:23S rRNA (guanosine2251-2'-O)-methyltransferase
VPELLYGRQAVRESLRAARRKPRRLLLSEGLSSLPIIGEIVELARTQGLGFSQVSRQEMSRVVGHELHQGVALETSAYPYAGTGEMLELATRQGSAPLLLLLDLIQDVHNLGSLIRTAEAVGVHGLVIQERRAAGVTPATVNTSSGAAEHVLIAQVTNLPQEMERLKSRDLWTAGLEDASGAQVYTEVDLTSPLALVVGSESDGLRRLVRDRCDWILRIPMWGQINSLNAAVAGSVALYEVMRQRQVASRPR